MALDRRIRILAVAWAVNTFAYSIAYPFLPLYLHSTRGFAMSRVGLMYLVMGLARMLSPAASGMLVDRCGRRGVLVGAPLLRSLLFFALAGAVHAQAGFWQLAGLLFCVMFVGGFFQNASDAYVTDITSPADRPEAFSQIRVGLNLGWMIGPAVGAFMARTPFELLFAITGGFCLLTPLIAWRHCQEPGRHQEEAAEKPLLAVLRRDRLYLRLLLFAFPLMLVHSQLISTLSIFARERLRMTGNEIGFIYTLNGLVVILFQMRLSRAVDGVHLARRVVGGALFYACGYFGLAFCSQVWQAFAAVAVFSMGELLIFPSLGSAASRMAPPGMVGRYMGIHGLAWGLGLSVGPFLGSLLYQYLASAPVTFWGIVVLAALVSALCFTRLAHEERLAA